MLYTPFYSITPVDPCAKAEEQSGAGQGMVVLVPAPGRNWEATEACATPHCTALKRIALLIHLQNSDFLGILLQTDVKCHHLLTAAMTVQDAKR